MTTSHLPAQRPGQEAAHLPAQRPAPDSAAVQPAAAVSGAAELGWGRLLRVAAARAGLAMVASLVLWSLLPALVGWTPRVILSGSMEPRIHVGDVVVTRDVPAATLAKGQVVTVTDPDHPGKTRTHRVLRVAADGALILKGDANLDPDSARISAKAVQGVGVLRVPFVGRPAYWAAERNWLALGLTAGLLGLSVICAFPGQRKREDIEDDDSAGTSPGRTSRSRRVAAAVAVSVIAVGAVGAPADAAFKRPTANLTNTMTAAANFYPYRVAVLADSPNLYWRLAETSGATVADTAPGAGNATLFATTSAWGQAGALSSETLNKSLSLTSGVVTGNTAASPGDFSVEAWVKSTSTNGGRILGMGNGSGSTPSTSTDRQLYLAPTGEVMFSVGKKQDVMASTGAVNNGAWHYVVGTFTGGNNGTKLYVDGVLQASGKSSDSLASGYWRAGGEQLTGWPGNPTGYHLQGALDELAVYPAVLTPARILAHYNVAITP